MQRFRVYLTRPTYLIGLLVFALSIAVLMGTVETPTIAAQPGPMATCGAQIRAALTTAISYCESLVRNQACYGHTLGVVSMRNEAETSPWVNVGDVADLTRIRGVSLSPMNVETGDWGVALMEVQGSLPDTLPGQNVTVVAFGDVILEDTVSETVRIPAQALAAANVRVRPSVGSWVVGGVTEGEAVTVTGQATTAAGETWLQVKYDDYRTGTGWILASLVDVAGQAVPTVSEDSLIYGNMQAFYLRTGLGVPQCAELPSSGVILKTPEDAGLVSININGIDLSLGSTAFVSMSSTEAGGSTTLDITLLEGHSLVNVMGEERVLIPGSRTSVALDPSGRAASPPSEAVDYEPQALEPYSDLLRDLSVELPAPAGEFNDEWDSDINGDFGASVIGGASPNRPGTQPNQPGANPPIPGSNGAPQEWNDDGSCNNPPPAHAPAHGWRQRCEGGGSGGGDNNGGGEGNGNGNGGGNGTGNGNGNENGNGGGNGNGNGGGNGNGNGNGGGNGNGNGGGNGGGNGNGNGGGNGGGNGNGKGNN